MGSAHAKPDVEHLRQYIRALYSRGKIEGERGRVFDLAPTGYEQPNGEALRDIAIAAGVQRTIETGFAYGLSGLFLCEALLRVGAPDAAHVAIDPYQQVLDDSGLRNFRTAGIESLLEFHREPSQILLPRFWHEGRQFDLGFIDGDHRFDGAFTDFYFMHRVIKVGGMIVVDDMWMPSVSLAVRFFETNFGYVRDNPLPTTIEKIKRRLMGRSGGHDATLQHTAIFRRPEDSVERAWNHFVPFA